jgi:hypothetical protein
MCSNKRTRRPIVPEVAAVGGLLRWSHLDGRTSSDQAAGEGWIPGRNESRAPSWIPARLRQRASSASGGRAPFDASTIAITFSIGVPIGTSHPVPRM